MKHDEKIESLIAQINAPGAAPKSLSKSVKQSFLSGVAEIAGNVDREVEVDFNDNGQVRSISGAGLFREQSTGDVAAFATKFINDPATKKALGLRYATLVLGEVMNYEAFSRVEFKQVANIKGFASAISVRGGFVHVYIDKDGQIIQVNSTVRRGSKPATIGKIISEQEAVELAVKKLDVKDAQATKCTLVLSSHDNRMDPVYEVTLSAHEPRRLVLFLVKAKTGEVVYAENKLHFSQRRSRGSNVGDPRLLAGIAASAFLRIPDYNPNEPITKQVSKGVIEGTELKDPKVLANDRYTMMTLDAKGKWQPVRANSQGTFEFDPLSKDPVEVSKFSATVAFLWLNTQDATLEAWGGLKIPRAINVYIDDPSVSNNAYFDPGAWDIHDGVGTGIENGGLVIHISWDPGVNLHENTHKRNAAEAPGKDLPGMQGAAANEATADVYGDLLFDLYMRFKGGKALGHDLTTQDIVDSTGIIGKYCAAPDGIRTQDNTKKYPGDIENEEHSDGLIIGGAFFDLLRAIAKVPGISVEDVLSTNGKLFLNGTRLLPAHKVMFTDYVRAYLTVDKTMFGGKYKDLISEAFAKHGIKLGTVTPTKRKKTSTKGGSKGKSKGKSKGGSKRKAA